MTPKKQKAKRKEKKKMIRMSHPFLEKTHPQADTIQVLNRRGKRDIYSEGEHIDLVLGPSVDAFKTGANIVKHRNGFLSKGCFSCDPQPPLHKRQLPKWNFSDYVFPVQPVPGRLVPSKNYFN